jgi:Mrp family chromosome partitioning ATPase/predicted Fe-Mo cluster-binding NifX family protein
MTSQSHAHSHPQTPSPSGNSCPSHDAPPKPSDAARQQEEDQRRLTERLSHIREKILVLSGKGGVGKSTVAANLAMSLALAGHKVGLLDIDIHGPSIPKLMGLENEACGPTAEVNVIEPVPLGENLKVMSIGFLLRSPRDAVVWRGPLKFKVIQQFLADVAWGPLDVLVIDSPPGTGDEPLSVAQLVGHPASAIVVTTPQDVALADVRRSITFCQQLHLQILGVVENMSGFVCPHCGKTTDLFKSGGGERLAQEMGVPFLGKVPLDPQVVDSGDAGTPLVQRFAESPTALAFANIAKPILSNLQETHSHTCVCKQETKRMKIAIPLSAGRLAEHFGHCEQFALLDTDATSKRILKQTMVVPPPHEPGVLPRWLHEQGAQVIIAGGMGRRAVDLFAQNGIAVHAAVAGRTPEETVQAFFDGALGNATPTCGHGRGDGSHHECHHGHTH